MNDKPVDLREVENALRRMQLAGYDLRRVFSAARKDMRLDQREHAQAQEASDGRWQALSPATQRKRTARRNRQGRKRTRRQDARRVRVLGRLPNAFKIEVGAHSIKAISRVPWSGVHQFGGPAGRGAQIPAREFLWASTKLLVAISRKAVDFMVGAWDKKNRL